MRVENDGVSDPTVIRPDGDPDEATGQWYEMTPEANVGKRTRRHREQRGWSQEELGRRLGNYGFAMHQTTVAKLENGSRPIRLNEVQALADIFGVSPGDLFEEDTSVQNEHEVAVAAREVQRASAALAEAARAMDAAASASIRAGVERAAADALFEERRAAAAAAEARLKVARRG